MNLNIESLLKNYYKFCSEYPKPKSVCASCGARYTFVPFDKKGNPMNMNSWRIVKHMEKNASQIVAYGCMCKSPKFIVDNSIDKEIYRF